LRAAIQEANASPIRADVTVPPLVFTLTLGAVDDSSASGDLDLAPVSGTVYVHAPQPGARIRLGYQSSDVHALDLLSGTVGISGIGVDESAGGVGVANGVTATLGAVSAGRLDVAAGGTAHLSNDTIGTVQSSGAIDASFTTLTDVSTDASATTTLSASIVSRSCLGPVTSLGYNLRGNGTACGAAGPGDQFAADLGLGSTGGHLVGRPPQQGSPAFDAIPMGVGPCAGSPPSDEHGHARPAHGACDMGAVESQAPLHFTVNTSADAHDVSLGNGTCATSAGTCSLRAAVDEVDRLAGTWAGSTVALTADPTLSLPGSGDDDNATGDLDILSGLVLSGGGHRISASGLDRVVDVDRTTVSMDHVTLTGGQADIGGSLRAGGGADVTISFSTVTGNQAAMRGGGASVGPGSSLTVDHSAILSNSAGNFGGGISSEGGTSAVLGGRSVVTQSTLGTNTAPTASAVGAGVYGGSASLVETTVVGQGSGPALQGSSTPAPCSGGPHPVCPPNGIVSGSANIVVSASPACGVFAVAGTYSVVSDPSCGVPAQTAVLGPLADNGGPTLTYLPYSVSPGVDAIPPGSLDTCDAATPTDQRGVSRPQGTGCDVGAVEGTAPAPTKSFTVTGAADKLDLVPGDGICDAGGGCTLRAAIEEANRSTTTSNTIVIKAGVNPKISRAGSVEDANGKGDFDIKGNLTIEGNGATVDGAQLDRVFDHFGGTLTIRNLTITGGKLTGNTLYGGGIRSTGGLVLENVTVVGNALVGDGTLGGGVASFGGPVSLTRSTVTGNTLTGNNISGAGVMVSLGTLTVRSSTFNGNSAGGYQSRGGGFYLMGAQGTVSSSTFVDNTAFTGAAFDTGPGVDASSNTVGSSLDLRLSTVAGNHGFDSVGGGLTTKVSGSALSAPAGFVCNAMFTSSGFNVSSGDATYCGLTQPTDSSVADLLLGPLAPNGGATQTLLPQAGSPLLDRIPIGTTGLCDGTVTTDQRGSVRPHGSACDAGSVER